MSNLPHRLLSNVPHELPNELCETLLQASNVRIERIISRGHKSPDGFWYDQNENEWVLLVAGAAKLEFENETIEMQPGSFVNIPAHKRHRVAWTDPEQTTIWLAVFYV
jgi:cupin 2 domain-containing protein